MDEAARRQYCNLLMFDVDPPNPRIVRKQMPIMVDTTTSLGIGCDNFVFTSFLEPIKVSPSNAPHSSKNKPSMSSNNSDTPTNSFVDESPAQKSEPKAQKAPRPPNAFILYRKAKQPEVIKKHGHTSNAKLSQILAEMWKNEPEEIKYEWKKKADLEKVLHSLKYPGYVYRPKKTNKSKKKRNNKRAKDQSTTTTTTTTTNYINVTSDTYHHTDSGITSDIPLAAENGNISPINNTGTDEGFDSYLRRSWEEYMANNSSPHVEDYELYKQQQQHHQQYLNILESSPYNDIQFLSPPIAPVDEQMQINNQFTAEDFTFSTIDDYHVDPPLSSRLLAANLDPIYSNDSILHENFI